MGTDAGTTGIAFGPSAEDAPENITFLLTRRSVRSCRRRKRNHIILLRCHWREADLLRLRNAMLASQVSIRFHCQRAPVLVSEPAGNGWNVHGGFNASRCKQMPQVVMGDAICSDLLARSIERLLAFPNGKHFAIQ